MEKQLLGWCIFRNYKYTVGVPTASGKREWVKVETGFQLDFLKRRIYSTERVAKEAIEQFKTNPNNKEDEFEIKPIFIYN